MREWWPTRRLNFVPFWGSLTFSAASSQPLGGGVRPARMAARAMPPEGGMAVASDDTSADAQLAAIYREFSSQIHTYSFHLLGNQEDADDVTQEVFIRAYSRLGQLREQASLRSWLYRIATNLCMDHLRRRSRVKRVFGMEISLGGSSADDASAPYDVAQPKAVAELEGVAERDHISLALKRMPDKYAVCLLLHSLQGFSYREIAEVVGISPGAAAVRLSRARDLFARYYEELRKEDAQ